MATEIKVYTGQRPVRLHCGRLLQPTCVVLASRSVQALDTYDVHLHTFVSFWCTSGACAEMSNYYLIECHRARGCREEHRESAQSSIKRQIRHLIRMVSEDTKALNFKTGQMTVSRNVTWTCRKQMVGGLRESAAWIAFAVKQSSHDQWTILTRGRGRDCRFRAVETWLR